MSNVYSTQKVNFHPDIIKAFMGGCGHKMNPTFVHLMPQNLCNHDCSFCSYRLSNWKNSEQFDVTKHIPWEKMEEIIDDLLVMGVKAVEITGGGEPLAYPYIDKLLDRLAETDLEVGLVTNGTLLTEDRADRLYRTRFKWARVSIDAGCPASYAKIRRVGENHWKKAWEGIRRLVERREKGKHVIGTGYVVTDENYGEVYDGLLVAGSSGVDNTRVSVAFTPMGASILPEEEVQNVQGQINAAKLATADSDFEVADIFQERVDNLKISPTQDYDYCGSKDLLCVIEGECKVYTCCTLTGSPKGLMGSVADQRFIDLWKKREGWRKRFNVRARCKCPCLYEQRNMAMLELMNPPDHLNFI